MQLAAIVENLQAAVTPLHHPRFVQWNAVPAGRGFCQVAYLSGRLKAELFEEQAGNGFPLQNLSERLLNPHVGTANA